MNDHKTVETIRLGDRVTCGRWPHASGRVADFVTFGKTTLAEVEWDTPGLPERVNVTKLCLAEGYSAQAA